MATVNFENWLAEYLGGNISDVRRLLKNKTAVHFLIAWSIFESRLFSKQRNGKSSVNAETICEFSKIIANKGKFEVASICEHAMYFHARYQCSKNFRHLMFEKSKKRQLRKTFNHRENSKAQCRRANLRAKNIFMCFCRIQIQKQYLSRQQSG